MEFQECITEFLCNSLGRGSKLFLYIYLHFFFPLVGLTPKPQNEIPKKKRETKGRKKKKGSHLVLQGKRHAAPFRVAPNIKLMIHKTYHDPTILYLLI